MVGKTESPDLVYLEHVPNRRTETRLPIIQKYIFQERYIIYNDQCASFLRLTEGGFDHFSVNNSDPGYKFIASD